MGGEFADMWKDEQYDQATEKVVPGVFARTPSIDNGDFSQMWQNETYKEPSGVKKRFDLQAEMWAPIQGFVDDIKTGYGQGEPELNDALIGWKVMKFEKSYEDALKDMTDHKQQKQIKYKTEFGALVAPLIQGLPELKYLAESAAQGATIIGGAGAVGGAAVTPVAPGVGAAIVGTAGLGVGAESGAVTAAGILAAGRHYLHLRKAGATDETARLQAAAVGAYEGFLQGTGLRALGGVAKAGFLAPKAAAMFGSYLKEVGFQTKIAVQGKVAEQLSTIAAKLHDRTPDMIPSLDDLGNNAVELFQTAAATATASAVAIPILKTGGAVLGNAVQRFMTKKAEPKTLPEAVEQLDDMLDAYAKEVQAVKTGSDKVVAELEAALDAQTKEYEGKITESKQLQKQIGAAAKADQPTADLRAQQSALDKEAKALKKGMKATQKQLEKVKADQHKLPTTEVEKPRSTARPLKDQLEVLKFHINKLKNRIDDAKTDEKLLVELELQFKAAQLERARLNKAINKEALAADEARLSDYIDQKNAKFEELKNLQRRLEKARLEDAEKFDAIKNKQRNVADEMDVIQKAISDLQKKVDKIKAGHLATATARLERKLKLAEGAKGKFGKPKSKYDLDSQKVLTDYQKFIKDPAKAEAHLRESAEQILNDKKMQDAMAQNDEIPPMPDTSRSVTDRVAGDTLINYKDADAVNALADKIESVSILGRDKRLNAKQDRARELDAIADEVFAGIQGTKPLDLGVSDAAHIPISDTEQFIRTGGIEGFTFNTLVDHLFQFGDGKAAKYFKEFQDAIDEADANIDRFSQEAIDAATGGDKKKYEYLMKQALEKGGDRKWLSKLLGRAAKYTDQDGVIQEYNPTIFEFIQDAMDMRNAAMPPVDGVNPKMFDGLKNGNKFTFLDKDKNNIPLFEEDTFEHLIDEAMSKEPQLRDVANGFLDFLNSDEQYARANAVHEEEFGFPHPREAMYTGPRKRDGGAFGAEGSYGETMLYGSVASRNASLVPGSMKDAVRADKPYVRTAADSNIHRFIRDRENFIALRKHEEVMRRVFTDPRIVKLIERRFDSEGRKGYTLQLVKNAYTSMLGVRGQTGAAKFQAWADIRGRLGTAYTYGKADSMLKQFSSVINLIGWEGMTVEEFFNGVGQAVLHPKRTWDTMRKSDGWDVRYGKNVVTELAERRDLQQLWGSPKADSKWIEKTGAFLLAGDKLNALVGGYAVRMKTLQQELAKGTPLAEAEKKATATAWRAIKETQSSSSRDQMTAIERSGELGKWFGLFAKQPLQIGGLYSTAVRRLLANPTKENFKQFARVVGAAHVAQAMFVGVGSASYLAVKGLIGDGVTDEDIQTQALKVGSAALLPGRGLPLTGDVTEQLRVHATNQVFGLNEKTFDLKYLPFALAASGVNFGGDLMGMAGKAVRGEEITPMDIMTAVVHGAEVAPAAKVKGAGTPILPVVRTGKKVVPKDEKKSSNSYI